ncbi:MAG: UDP-N-acetylmuramate dehydrogenase [Patescibacteria group bacterium]|nr:UDP-N-acetylmuramate dehydrogenase [Patescibacteria group bacterium]
MTTSTQSDIKIGEPLAKHCRFGVGGAADFFVEVHSAEEIKEAINYASKNHLRYFVYGGGSNIFFDDKGFRGMVIQIVGGTFQLISDTCVQVDAGYSLPKLVRDLGVAGWGGLEFLGNIPGSLGGAIVGNAGCYGKCIADVLVSAQIFSVSTQHTETWQPADFAFDYRHSGIKEDPDKIVLSATLKLCQRPSEEILTGVEAELNERQSKHPHTAMCAGSFFKNPTNLAAWQAISDAGLAQARIGDAGLSDKHANFLINYHQATSQDILQLARYIQKTVKDKLGVELKPEVRYIGENGLQKI